jgi:dihydrofolate synthase/folylpolyglutamate synthase
MAPDAILERLTALHPKGIDLSLDRMRRVLAALGHPERALPPVVHVAGTNGKGSLVAYLRAIFEAAGYRPHVYTSPHMVRFNERIVVAGREIEDMPLSAILERVERINDGQPITFFEITTAAAFLAFAETAADVALLEVGMGGRLDATNLVDRPALSAITPISRDHVTYLGETIPLIAAEKAAILKPGVPAIIGRQPPEAASVIAEFAARVAAPLHRLGTDFDLARHDSGFRFTAGGIGLDLPPPGLAGLHQYDNAASAVAAALLLRDRFTLDDRAIAQGIAGAVWPGRLQRLTRGPLQRQLGPGIALWLDGAHNEGGGRALAATLREWGDAKLRVVYGSLNTKDPDAFLRQVAPLAEMIRTVAIPDEPLGLSAESLAAVATTMHRDAAAAPSIEAAVGECAARGAPACILICGALRLAGKILEQNG